MRKRIITLSVALMSMLQVGNIWALNGTKPSGSGDPNNPFIISTVDELIYFADYVNTEHVRTEAQLDRDNDWENPEIEDGEIEPIECNMRIAIDCGGSFHIPIKHEGKPATCDEDGTMDYYECQLCGSLFYDEEGERRLLNEDGEEVDDAVDAYLTLPKHHRYDFETHRCKYCGVSNIGTFYVDLNRHEFDEKDVASNNDLIKFVAPLSGCLKVWTEGDVDTFGTLFSGDDMSSLTIDDDTYGNYNFLIEYQVEAGKTYWIGVRTLAGNPVKNQIVRIHMDEYLRYDLNDDETINVVDVIQSLTSGEILDLNGDGENDEQDVKILINLILEVVEEDE